MSASVRAWLLDWPLHPIALAPCEVIEIVEAPEIHRVPFGPDWCRALLYWRDRWIPLALSADTTPHALEIVVTAYQKAAHAELEYCALPVRSPPRQIDVTASMDTTLPRACVFAEEHVRACFEFERSTILVPELSRLFEPVTYAA